jgi:dTDP-4-dehydrorhamnose reductase
VKWLITGAVGMVGSDLRTELESRGEVVVALAKADLDITNRDDVMRFVSDARPDVIVNCAAYTKVDLAESEELLANAINGSAVEFLVAAADQIGAHLIQLSTDFVFDGTATRPYDVNDATRPLSVYGSSKLIGEHAAAHHTVLRTSWLFGVHGPNFVEAIRNQIRKGTNPLRVVHDQRGRPTYTPHLANAIIRIANLGARGIVHYADEQECTWFDFASAINEELGSQVTVVPVTSDQFPRPAKRPAYSVLSTERYERLTGVKPESWRDGLREYLALRT